MKTKSHPKVLSESEQRVNDVDVVCSQTDFGSEELEKTGTVSKLDTRVTDESSVPGAGNSLQEPRGRGALNELLYYRLETHSLAS